MGDGMFDGYVDLAAESGWGPCTECGLWQDRSGMVEVDGFLYCPQHAPAAADATPVAPAPDFPYGSEAYFLESLAAGMHGDLARRAGAESGEPAAPAASALCEPPAPEVIFERTEYRAASPFGAQAWAQVSASDLVKLYPGLADWVEAGLTRLVVVIDPNRDVPGEDGGDSSVFELRLLGSDEEGA